MCSPSSVIVAAHGRVKTARPSALPFALCLSLLSPLGISDFWSFWSRVLLLPSLALPAAYGCAYATAMGKMFPDKYSFTPTTQPPHPQTAYHVCLNANQLL